ncbi:MAG: energy-coupling factor transporter transmembrane protein EcfT [Desulfobacter sp.]|nr:MAG: energy-coupling factor transporter transmembrane protein EcfT [Desulfobacter sp.]
MPALFEFKSGRTLVHNLDPRCKFIILCILGAGLASASWLSCTLILAPLLLMIRRLGTGPVSLAWELRTFILFLSLIILVRSLATPGTPFFSLFGHPLSFQGAAQGGLVALRFFTVMALGLVFSATTKPSELKAAVQWFLKPVPFIPEKRAGMVIGLSLRFLPMIFSQARESGQAIAARCGGSRKNPVKRISILSLALLSKTFRQADSVSLAMEARAYTEERTDPQFGSSGREIPAILLAAAAAVLFFFI